MLITGSRITGPEHALADLAKLGYAASTRTVTVRSDLAVVVSDYAVNFSIRAPDRAWRLVAAIVRPGTTHDWI